MSIFAEVEFLTDRAVTWLEQLVCSHQIYRPGLVKGEPGRICRDCKATEVISEDAFYAQFGENAMAEVKKRQADRKTV